MISDEMSHCRLCPRNCGADRYTDGSTENSRVGFCGVDYNVKIARAALHMWEEPCISGKHGSGTVFFSGCNLRCIYCQNRKIALANRGKIITPEQLGEEMLRLQGIGANNINLVTASHYVPQVADVLKTLRNPGKSRLSIPVVYNTSSYEKVETLEKLEGLVDVYLPDFKYISKETAAGFSFAPDYPETAVKAIDEMLRQVGEPVFHEKDENGSFADDWECEEDIMTRGVIIRHLVLPGHVEESKEAIRFLHERYGDRVYLSIMNQYTPPGEEQRREIADFPEELTRTLTQEEYDEVVDYAIEIGVENGFIQEGETAKESFIPDFDME